MRLPTRINHEPIDRLGVLQHCACRNTKTFLFVSISDVCPEPVLVTWSFLNLKIASIATNEGRFSFRRTAQEHAVVFERDGLAVPGVLALELVQPDAAGGSERASGRMTSSEKLNAAAEAKRTVVPEIKCGAKRRPEN
jgi:hypothetical protein